MTGHCLGRFVTSHPRSVFTIALLIALLIAAPALKVRLGAADAGTGPKSQTTRQAYDILSDKTDGFGPGFTSPITVVIKGDKNDANKIYTALQGQTGDKGDIVFVSKPFSNEAGDVSVRYDRKRGYPTDVSLDRIRLAIDDEIYWTTRGLVALGS